MSIEERVRETFSESGAPLTDAIFLLAHSLDELRERVERLEEKVGGALDRAVWLLEESEPKPPQYPHDWGIDSYRCLRCGTTRDDAPDQECRPKPKPSTEPSEPASLVEAVAWALVEARVEQKAPETHAIRAVADWLDLEGEEYSANNLRAQLEP